MFEDPLSLPDPNNIQFDQAKLDGYTCFLQISVSFVGKSGEPVTYDFAECYKEGNAMTLADAMKRAGDEITEIVAEDEDEGWNTLFHVYSELSYGFDLSLMRVGEPYRVSYRISWGVPLSFFLRARAKKKGFNRIARSARNHSRHAIAARCPTPGLPGAC